MTYAKRIRIRAAGLAAGVALAASALVAGSAPAADNGGVGPGGVPETGEGTFPVIGKHTYGDGLGAGRDHQGQDVMAKCGRPVVAAQPGRVQFVDYQATGAGNYVVIDGTGALEDTVYMHLQQGSTAREGDRVSAGDSLGRVGTTGSSNACHLHFEIWSGTGWYDGGSPIDPLPDLRQWDRAETGAGLGDRRTTMLGAFARLLGL